MHFELALITWCLPKKLFIPQLLLTCFQIDIFTEELVRAGSAAILSTLINRLDPTFRRVANLGW